MRNEDLDQLFKDKLGGSPPAYNPQAWERMASLLDRQQRPVAAWYWQYSAIVVMLGLLVYGLQWQQGGLGTQAQNPDLPVVNSEGKRGGAPFPLPPSASEPWGPLFMDSLARPAHSRSRTGKPTQVTENSASSLASSASKNAGKQGNSSPNLPKNERPVTSRSAIALLSEIEFPGLLKTIDTELRPEQELISLPDWDSTANLSFGDRPAPLPSPQFTHQLWISAGPSTGQRFTGNQTHSVRGFHAGAQYQLGISPSVSFSLGAHYRRIDKLQMVTEDDTTLFSNQGREDIHTERTFRSMELISLPLRFHYNWNGRHRLSLGFYLNYVLAQSMEMKETTQTPKSGVRVAQDEITGMHDEFHRWNTGLTAGYHYSITPRLSAGLRFRYGLDDLTQAGAHSDIASRNRLWQGDFVLGYRLF